MNDSSLDDAIIATEKLRNNIKQDDYAAIRNEREKATFSMMMKMNPEALTNIRKEFFAREDSVTLDEFMYIMQKHLMNRKGVDSFTMETPEQKEFGLNMFELFKDIDINGDGNLEWQEFTSFTVEKANLLNKRAKLTSIAHYHDTSPTLDISARYRHRHDIARFVNLPSIGQFAVVEDHKNAIFIFNSRLGKHITTINTESAPIAIACVPEKDKEFIVTSGADMTLSTFSLDDPNPKRRYKAQSTWATPGVQMALAFANDSRLLYSGATNGNIYSWNMQKRSLVTTLSGHTDIVMNLMILQKLNNIASASLDKTLGIWDSHTNEEILRLHGHKKGVFDLSYSPDYRLLFSCGFEHDACVWSPFVKSLVYRLKGHHASLVGVQSIQNSPEIITADTSGVFKLWDIRNFQCVQTFAANLSGHDTKDSSKLTCFMHTKLPSANSLQKEDDSRIYAASKMLFSFDQARVVHEATTDYTNVFWVAWISTTSLIITVSERNVIVWDAFLGSKKFTHSDVCGEEISACCLDHRKRKILIGNVSGKIGVYNCSNGQYMKSVYNSNDSIVVSLEYFDEGCKFIAGFANGLICIYDENDMEECSLLRSFDHFNRHGELISLKFCPRSLTVATAGGSSNCARLWDYNTGKCDAELLVGFNSQVLIVQVMILEPYAIVVTSDTNGNIILWGSRATRWQGIKICGFLNLTPVFAEYEHRSHQLAGFEENDAPLRMLPPHVAKSKATNSDGKQLEAFQPSLSRPRGLRSSFTLTDNNLFDSTVKQVSEQKLQKLIDDSEAKWGKVSSAFSLCWDPDSQLLFTGDDMGNLRCFDISDALQDVSVESMGQETSCHKIMGLCRHLHLNNQSAVPPYCENSLTDDFEIAASMFLLGRPGDAMSYLGVKFKWCVLGHHDRVITATCIPTFGLLTSAADRIVKMWSFDGTPLGQLLQSVPVGTRSRSWELTLDVDSIIQKENEELDEIIDSAKAVANDACKPNIYTMDFTGMQIGSESADFSRSMLRQRIEKSSQILGLDFPHQKSNESKSRDDATIGDASVSSSNKSLIEALKEIKSTDSAVDYDSKNKQLSYIQQKRKANKLLLISKAYAAKTGVELDLSNRDPNLFDTKSGDKFELDLDKLLISGSGHAYGAQDNGADINSIEQQSSLTVHSLQKPGGVKSKIMSSVADAQEKGSRTMSIVNSCKRFTSYGALDLAIKTNGKGSMSPAAVATIRARREKTIADLMYKDGIKAPSSLFSSATLILKQTENGCSSEKDSTTPSKLLSRRNSANQSLESVHSNES